MKPCIIRTDADHDQALARIAELMEHDDDPAVADELETLAVLVEEYEDRTCPIGPPTPVAAIQFRMEQQGLTRKDLEPYIGSKSKVSEVLSGKRSLSLSMMRRLHEGLGIPADVLLGATATPPTRTATPE